MEKEGFVMEETRISLKSVAYTMIRQRKVFLISLVVSILIMYAFLWYYTNFKASNANTTKSTAASSAATNTVTKEEKEKAKVSAETLEGYIDNAEYMQLNTNALYAHVLSYMITWKGDEPKGVSVASKTSTLNTLLTNYFASNSFRNTIDDIKDEYKGRKLGELVLYSRVDNIIVFNIIYSDNSYVDDIKKVIVSALNEKKTEYKPLIGDLDFELILEEDKAIDGSQYKTNQDKYLAQLKAYKTILSQATTSSQTAAKPSTSDNKEPDRTGIRIFIGIGGLVACLLVGIIISLVISFASALYGKKIYTSTDISDILRKATLCIFKSEPESRLDKHYYKNNPRYLYPNRYLTLLDKSIAEDGIRNIHIFNCSEFDSAPTIERIKETIKNAEVDLIMQDRKEDFYFDVKENEAVVFLVKGGTSTKDQLADIYEQINLARVNCLGAIFIE